MRTRLLLGGLVGLVGVLGLVSGSSAARSNAIGVWGGAVEVPGTATLNSGGYAQVDSVSCAAAGACTVGWGRLSAAASSWTISTWRAGPVARLSITAKPA